MEGIYRVDMRPAPMDEFLDAINGFIEREYGIAGFYEDYERFGELPIANTAYDFGDGVERSVQVSFDSVHLAWRNYVDGELLLVQPRSSLEEFIEEMDGITFDEVIYDCLRAWRRKYEKEDMENV